MKSLTILTTGILAIGMSTAVFAGKIDAPQSVSLQGTFLQAEMNVGATQDANEYVSVYLAEDLVYVRSETAEGELFTCYLMAGDEDYEYARQLLSGLSQSSALALGKARDGNECKWVAVDTSSTRF